MTPKEKEQHKQSLITARSFLEEFARQTDDDEARAEVWSEIRKFNKVLEIFKS
jgi:hypothetical protein